MVLANLAQVAGQYLWLLVGDGSLAENSLVVTATGVLFIVLMTFVNYRGIRLGEHVQRVLTYVQYVSLGIFAVAIVVPDRGRCARRGRGPAFDARMVQPRRRLRRSRRRRARSPAGPVHLLGLGHLPRGERGDREPGHDPRPRRGHFGVRAGGHLRLRGPAGDDVRLGGHGRNRPRATRRTRAMSSSR